MMHPTRLIALALAGASLLATGCFKLARTSPPVSQYVLGGIRPVATSRVTPVTPGLSIGLRRLELAPYLSTAAIIVRHADNQIVTSGFQRWAEGPDVGVNRAVAAYLADAPAIRSVDVAPWPVHSAHDYLLQLHVARFEGVASGGAARGGEAQLLARWEVIRTSTGAVAARGETDYRSTGWALDDYAGLVSRLDQGLSVLASEVVACLARIPAEESAGKPGAATTTLVPLACAVAR